MSLLSTSNTILLWRRNVIGAQKVPGEVLSLSAKSIKKKEVKAIHHLPQKVGIWEGIGDNTSYIVRLGNPRPIDSYSLT